MSTKPMLFNGPMVRAILEERKTQTRRIVKPQKHPYGHLLSPDEVAREVLGLTCAVRCPYGQPGDLIWVRETHGYEVRSVSGTPHEQIVYRATKPDAVRCYDCNGMEQPMKWHPSIHMPRWASRITLLVTDVRVERVQDISEGDAIHEGVETEPRNWDACYKDAFARLWESINGPGSWDRNEWVWVIEFHLILANVDSVLADPERYGIEPEAA